MKRIKVLSLAALVAFAACDEGTEPVVAPPVTGTITGVVTIEGTARSGVSVTLSSGAAATTDASGAYSFAGVNAGTYTVTISGFPTDATFSTTTKGATITTAGQVATVNFDGAFVRTSAIIGSVGAGGRGLAGVRVALSGASTSGVTANTDGNGQFAFGGLRAGSYTVTISNFDSGQYTFGTTSSTVNVGVGATQSVSFTGQLLATSTISGTVTIEGAAAAGVTATLSTGAVATTSATGAYSFGNLTAGSYTVTISGFPADAQFETVARTVTIPSAGSTVNANFSGTFIRTATLNGLVTVGGMGVGGVTVSISGAGTATQNTDANGLYSFSGLRAGSYTITISGWDAGMYTFATTSAAVTLTTGQSGSQNFAGAHVATAKIMGSLFIDEATANGTFEMTSEDKLMVAGIVVEAEGGAVNNKVTATTDANGDFMFENLTGGTYRISILGVTGAPLNPALPGNVAFRAGQATSTLVTLAVGGSSTVNWPFNITRQAIRVNANLATSATAAAGAPVPGASIRVYDTYANAVAAGAGGALGTATTDAAGQVTIRFNRTLDIGPGGTVDNVVFARVMSNPDAFHTLLAPAPAQPVIEIKYSPKDSMQVAPDFVRFSNGRVFLKIHAAEIDHDTLAGWTYEMRSSRDSIGAGSGVWTNFTNVNGDLVFDVDIATINSIRPGLGGVFAYPDTLWFRLAAFQAGAGGHGFSQSAEIMDSRVQGLGTFARFIWDGTVKAGDTIRLGTTRVKYTDRDITVRVHRELDDSTGTTALYSSGDGFDDVALMAVQLYQINANGTKTAIAGPVVPGGTGLVTFTNIATDRNYEVRARSTHTGYGIITDSLVTIMPLDGSGQVFTDQTLRGTAGNSSFAYKSRTNAIAGTILAADATPVSSQRVRIMAGPGNVGVTKDTTVVTNGAGAYTSLANLFEGPYTVSVNDSTTSSGAVWTYFKRLTTTTAPYVSGSGVNNTDALTGARDLQGYGVTATVNFQPDRMDTRILGNIVNDRDADLTTLDPNEALEGAVVRLYRDGSGAITYDSLIAEATTDINGRYSFTNLREGRYAIRWIDDAGSATVLRAIAKDSAVVTTAAAAGTGAQNTRTVGNQTHTAVNFLPRWNYNTSSLTASPIGDPDFTFLYRNTTVRGTAATGAAVAVAGMTVSLRRCNVSTGAASPPPVVDGVTVFCTSYLGTTVNTTTDASGVFTFAGLTEGVYEITPIPNTVGVFTTSTPAQRLYITVGTGDIETGTFTIS